MYWSSIRVAGVPPDCRHGNSTASRLPPDDTRLTPEQIFQTFDFKPHNPKYQLKIKQTLTVKPDDFYMHVTPRKGRDVKTILGSGAEKAEEQAAKMGTSISKNRGDGDEKIGLSVYYGALFLTSI